jgi:L-fucose isomerase-like protein
MACHEIIAGTVGREKCMGVVEFVMQDGPVTLCRCTVDNQGIPKAALIQGVVEANEATTFGAYGWVRMPMFQRFYKNVLLRHFPHHVGMNRAHVGNVLWEALGNYLGFRVYTADSTSGEWDPELVFPVA